MAQGLSYHLRCPHGHVRKLVGDFTPTVLIQLPVSMSEKAVDNGLSTCCPASHVEDLDRVPSSWIVPDPTLGFAGIVEVSQ